MNVSESHKHYVHRTYTWFHSVATWGFGGIIRILAKISNYKCNGGRETSLSTCESDLSFICAIRTYARRPKSITVTYHEPRHCFQEIGFRYSNSPVISGLWWCISTKVREAIYGSVKAWYSYIYVRSFVAWCECTCYRWIFQVLSRNEKFGREEGREGKREEA